MKYAIAVGFVLTLTYFFTNCGSSQTEAEIRKKIDSTIPIGSSKEDVIRFLQGNSFTFVIDPEGVQPPDDRDYSWITASLKQEVWGREHYSVVDFFFDKRSDSLVEYKIRSFYEGPGT